MSTCDASCTQYSKMFPALVASAIMLRGCGPSLANSVNSWLRTKTLTESI